MTIQHFIMTDWMTTAVMLGSSERADNRYRRRRNEM